MSADMVSGGCTTGTGIAGRGAKGCAVTMEMMV